MRKTHTSLVALGVAFGLPAAALAQEAPTDPAAGHGADHAGAGDMAGFAGLENATVLPDVQVARVTDAEGTVFHVIGGHGLGGQGLGGAGLGLDQAGAERGVGGTVPDPNLQDQTAADQDGSVVEGEVAVGEDAAPMEGDVAAGDEAAPMEGDAAAGAAPEAGEDATALDQPAEGAGTGQDVAESPELETDDPGAIAETGEADMSFEDQLAEAGFDDYEILDQAMVAEMMIGEGDGQPVFVIYGLEGEAD